MEVDGIGAATSNGLGESRAPVTTACNMKQRKNEAPPNVVKQRACPAFFSATTCQCCAVTTGPKLLPGLLLLAHEQKDAEAPNMRMFTTGFGRGMTWRARIPVDGRTML